MTQNPDLSRAKWRKAQRSSQQGECVEVAEVPMADRPADETDR